MTDYGSISAACPMDDYDVNADAAAPPADAMARFERFIVNGDIQRAKETETEWPTRVDPYGLWRTTDSDDVVESLAQYIDVNMPAIRVRDFNFVSPLAYAVMVNHEKKVTAALKRGGNPDQLILDSHTLLEWALDEGAYDIAKMLIRGGANVKSTKGTHPPLYYASRDEKMTRLLIELGADLLFMYDNRTFFFVLVKKYPLFYSLAFAALQQQLFEHENADQNLFYQTMAYDSGHALTELLKKKYFSSELRAAVQLAMRNTQVAYTLAHHVRPEIDDRAFREVYFDWSLSSWYDVHNTRGFSLNAYDTRGKKLVTTYAERGLTEPDGSIKSVFKMPGLNILAEDTDGRNIYRFLANENDEVRGWFERKISASKGTQFALDVAVADGDASRVEAILKSGKVKVDHVYVSELDGINYTALDVAVRNGFTRVAEVLLKHGADPNHSLVSNITMPPHAEIALLQFALSYGYPDIADLLIRHGAVVDAFVYEKVPLEIAITQSYIPLARLIASRMK